MTQAEALRLAAYLAGAYRNSDSSDGALAVLADQLLDLDHDRARGVVREIVAAGGAFAPSAGEIRNAYFTSVHNLPSVAGIVNEIAAARSKPIADAEFSHPIVREVALQVGYAKIREEWGFALREVQAAAEGLRAEFLKAVNVASLTGRAPNLTGRLALLARGIDYFQKPPVPALEAGWKWCGWRLESVQVWTPHRVYLDGEVWKGSASGTEPGDWAQYECPLLYAGIEPESMPPMLGAGPARPALPAGAWAMPQPKRIMYYSKAQQEERERREAEALKARDAKRAEVERIIKADPSKFVAMNAIERAALVRKMMAEVVLPPTPPTEARA